MTKVENIQLERREPGTIRSLSGRIVDVDKIEADVRERKRKQNKEAYIRRLRTRAMLAKFFKPEMLPEISPPEDIDPFEVLYETTSEVLKQVFDKPLE